jgi:3-oxoacyl-[acyl-carrier-protein] synthase III
MNPGGAVFKRTRQRFLYANDEIVLGLAVKYVAETIKDMTNVASEIGSIIYVSKAKYMINRKETGNNPDEIGRKKQKNKYVEMFK